MLSNYARENEWWLHGGNLYVDNFAAAGFAKTDRTSAEPGDVILMQVHSNVPNHAALWFPGDIILHHLYGRLSAREVYDGYWRKHTTHWLRYCGAPA